MEKQLAVEVSMHEGELVMKGSEKYEVEKFCEVLEGRELSIQGKSKTVVFTECLRRYNYCPYQIEIEHKYMKQDGPREAALFKISLAARQNGWKLIGISDTGSPSFRKTWMFVKDE